MQSPPFGILRINNSNSCHASNPSPKPGQAGQQGSGQLLPILVTNPTNRVSQCGGEGGAGEDRAKATSSTKKKPEPSQETECTLLIALMRLFWSEQPLLQMMFSWIICKLHMMKRKAAERKRRLQQLLLQRNSRQQTHIILVAVGPSFSAAFDTTTPRTSSGNNPPHQGVVTVNSQKEGDRRGI